VATPDLHFLTGKPLERLRDAATVVFLSQITLYSDSHGTVFRRIPERIIVSYDLWEEKFAVSIPGPAGTLAKLSSTAGARPEAVLRHEPVAMAGSAAELTLEPFSLTVLTDSPLAADGPGRW